MPKPTVGNAVADAITSGKAILKFISANDVGLTGGHQCGYYLPKSAWSLFTRHAPRKGNNADIPVRVTWPGWGVTESRVKWYGRGTRSEYRLTRFGKGFPWLSAEQLGSLLVVIPKSFEEVTAYMLESDEEIEEIQASLGAEIIGTFAIFDKDRDSIEDLDKCLQREFDRFVTTLKRFPSGQEFSSQARAALQACLREFRTLGADDSLLRSMNAEYSLFRIVERKFCEAEVRRGFADIDAFLGAASSILNRRKSRAGRSLENHVEHLFSQAGLPFEMRPKVDGRPDIVIPGRDSYVDAAFPIENIFIIGVKTTCKDRWRQVLREGMRQPRKHILTIQQGISTAQLREMRDANVSLIVPEPLHKTCYPKKAMQEVGIQILTVTDFIGTVRNKFRKASRREKPS